MTLSVIFRPMHASPVLALCVSKCAIVSWHLRSHQFWEHQQAPLQHKSRGGVEAIMYSWLHGVAPVRIAELPRPNVQILSMRSRLLLIAE
jgi:hypothetical protein